MQFLTLRDLILPPPLPALVAILIALSAAAIARTPAAFIVVIGCLAAIANALPNLLALRILAAAFIAAGVVSFLRRPVRWPALKTWKTGAPLERVASIAIATTILFLALAALGPVTDPDSLDYHLGVPLALLRHNGPVLQPHWLHARLTGLGEALNTLGLAAGTDCLGAVLQVSGLIAVMAALAGFAKTPKDRIFGLLLALPPALLPLATAQKPQLLPAAALGIAMILALGAVSTWDFALVFGCIAFAAGSKYSFAVSGLIVAAVALFRATKQKKLLPALGSAAIFLAIFQVPFLLRNWNLYGDPVSPFLESLRSRPDPELTAFAAYLGDVGGPHTLDGILAFLPHTVLPYGPGGIQTILGLGVIAIFLAPKRLIALPAGFAAVLLFTIWKGQMASRYLLEPFYWCAAAAVAAPWTKLKSALFYALTLQTIGVAAMALFAAALLFPGALTPGLRESVMRRYTFGYQQALWMDRVAPSGATIMVDSRAYALFPRPFLIPNCASCGGAPLLDLLRPDDLKQPGLVLFPEYPIQGNLPKNCRGRQIAGPETFPYAVRTPSVNSPTYQVIALVPDCK
ncbi:MAG TPA: DUF1420 family protein [Bryobacteraceae bacterium]|nr:DUF1420 family protein [Bryobacteraceae bacterium]